MSKTTRRNLLKAAAGGSLTAGIGLALKSGAAPRAGTAPRQVTGHTHSPVFGPLASATVSFGQWPTDQPLDRSPNRSPLNQNVHQLAPHQVTIQAGGSVNFIMQEPTRSLFMATELSQGTSTHHYWFLQQSAERQY